MAVYVFASLQPKPECRLKVEDALKALVSATRAEPGNISYDLFVAGAADSGFYLVESYRDEAALEAHKLTDHYRGYREKTADWLLEPPSVKVLYPLDVNAHK